MFSSLRTRPLEWTFSALLAFSVLWRGGKSIDATWIAALVIGVLFLLVWLIDRVDPSARSQRLNENICPSWVRGLSLGIVAWTILSYVTSQTRNYGLDEVLRTAFYILTFLWVIRLREQGKSEWIEKNLPKTLVLSGIVASAVGLFVYLFQPVSRFTGTFFDPRFNTDYWPNAWAEYLLIALPLSLVCIVLAKKQERARWLAGSIAMLASLYLSYSRGGMLAFGGESLILVIIASVQVMRSVPLKRQLKANAKRLTLAFVGSIVCAALVIAAVNAVRSMRYDVESMTNKVTFNASEGKSSVNERAEFWGQSMKMIKVHPIVGWGPYSFRFVQPASMTSVLATADHPHNAFLKMAAERGLPAALMFTLLIVGCLVAGLRTSVSGELSGSFVQTGALLAVCGVLLHVMIDYNLQFTGIGLAFFALLGLLAPMRSPLDARRASFIRWKTRRRMSDFAALMALALLIVTAREGWFLVTSSFGRHAVAAGDSASALEWFELSHNELFSRDLLLSEAQIQLQRSETGAALKTLGLYQKLNPFDDRAWRIKGEVLLASNQPSDAVSALEKAYAYGKYTDAGILRLLLQGYAAERSDAYKSRKEEFDALFRAFGDAIIDNTHFIALSENAEELQKVSRLLSLAFPADADRYTSIAREALIHAKKERSSYTSKAPGILW